MFIGVGLLLLGVVAGLLLARPQEPGSSPGISFNSGERSVVPVAVNYPAPALTLTGLDGQQASLADYQGQVILVNNWATWCPPCKAEMPTLQAYYADHRDQGFLLIGINAADPEEKVTQFVSDYRLTFPIWLDPQNMALEAFQNQSLPSSYVIDRQGLVRLAWTGEVSKAILEKYVTPLLEK
jgi:peroxiredoxin